MRHSSGTSAKRAHMAISIGDIAKMEALIKTLTDCGRRLPTVEKKLRAKDGCRQEKG